MVCGGGGLAVLLATGRGCCGGGYLPAAGCSPLGGGRASSGTGGKGEFLPLFGGDPPTRISFCLTSGGVCGFGGRQSLSAGDSFDGRLCIFCGFGGAREVTGGGALE